MTHIETSDKVIKFNQRSLLWVSDVKYDQQKNEAPNVTKGQNGCNSNDSY